MYLRRAYRTSDIEAQQQQKSQIIQIPFNFFFFWQEYFDDNEISE